MRKSKITFDGKMLFDSGQHTIQTMSWKRESFDYRFGGLDGVFSLDLGRRTRTLKQHGWIAADSAAALNQMIEEITSCIDGEVHDLVDAYGVSYANVRMETFTPRGEIKIANQIRCEYEIQYTQFSM